MQTPGGTAQQKELVSAPAASGVLGMSNKQQETIVPKHSKQGRHCQKQS